MLKQVKYLLLLLVMIACGAEDPKVSNPIAPAQLDTLLADKYILNFVNADSFPQTDIFGDLAFRNQLTDTIPNFYDRSLRIQNYLLDKFGEYFMTTDSSLILILANEQTMTFPIWDDIKGVGYTFGHYFETINYYLIRVQFVEGNCWMLVNRDNGYKTYISGLPYLSPDNKKILTINTDLEAGYSFNGIELYSVLRDSLQTEFIKETNWGPVDLKWINDNQVYLKRLQLDLDSITQQLVERFDYKLMTIEKRNDP